MSCQDSLVRQQPCTSTYLFSLLAIGHGRRRWRPAGAFVTMLSALMLHAFFLGSLLPTLCRCSDARHAEPLDHHRPHL